MRLGNHYVAWRKLRLCLLELSLITGSALGGALALGRLVPLMVSSLGGSAVPTRALLGPSLAVSTALAMALYIGDLFDLRRARADAPMGTRLLRTVGSVAVVFAAFRLLTYVLPRLLPRVAPGLLLAALGGGLVCVGLLRSQFDRVIDLAGARLPIVLLGRGPIAHKLARDLDQDGDAGVTLTGQLDESSEGIVATLRAKQVHTVVVTTQERRGSLPVAELLSARLLGFSVLDIVQFYERYLRRVPVGSLRPSDVIFTEVDGPGRLHRALCRALHVVAAVVILALAAPVLLLAALAIKLDSRGPVFYRQARVGLGGRTFTVLKFRTMRADAEREGAQWARARDDRITRVGRWLRKTRLDEVPQLINVLRGEMALVGPRPERPEFVQRLKEEIPYYGMRESVLPGLTGWAQVKYPYAASIDEQKEKLEYDLYYVRHRTVFLDLIVLLQTFRVVLLGRGAR